MKTNVIMKIMNIVFWIVFIGLCIKTGTLIVSFFMSVFAGPEASEPLYLGVDFFDYENIDLNHYINLLSFLTVLTGMKAYIAYLVVKLFMKFDLNYPFNENAAKLISKIAYFALSIGIVALIANQYTERMLKRGAEISQIDWGAEEFLFFAGIIYILALVFKRGVEIQSENDLTI
ncbi:hypothetical protein Aeqsu_2180 [Aequorivita sublithincola DSM 14238]|uniref:DUF2975 domain-containing protein n=1 Tax=Aequorivita sublithincola (strain DSM 14238 / LMG 21431 / ACAM 643 / 9-3) TaxID=746697 RepID=I3YXC2_AEQSU|nr:DUF2975 domain-containing protein [Aequorivita sublithincola]AFL81640.1 hypothetical protein Aeqsu_2180 [Aequorivita sublithincola DSM 14238]